MTKWHAYGRFSRATGLKNEGRELLGREVLFTEKRDGENVSLWSDGSDFQISSHNLEQADDDIIRRFRETPEFQRAMDAILVERGDYQHDYILYGELLKLVGPTRIEPKRKHVHWILFDAWDGNEEVFVDYTILYQLGIHYRIPVVKALRSFVPITLEELQNEISIWLKWCKRHRREGIVGKVYRGEQTFFKEKIDIPKLERLRPTQEDRPVLPPMPEETVLRALKHALDVVGEDNWKNTKIAMPEVAKQFTVEGNEHNFAPPRNFFQLYQSIPLEKIKTA